MTLEGRVRRDFSIPRPFSMYPAPVVKWMIYHSFLCPNPARVPSSSPAGNAATITWELFYFDSLAAVPVSSADGLR